MKPKIITLSDALSLAVDMWKTLEFRGVAVEDRYDKIRTEILSRMPMESALGTKYTRQTLPPRWGHHLEQTIAELMICE